MLKIPGQTIDLKETDIYISVKKFSKNKNAFGKLNEFIQYKEKMPRSFFRIIVMQHECSFDIFHMVDLSQNFIPSVSIQNSH